MHFVRMMGLVMGLGTKLRNLFLIFKTPRIKIWSLVIKTNAIELNYIIYQGEI